MEEFPILTDTQVALMKVDGSTGQVLTVDNDVVMNIGRNVYQVFDTIDQAYKYIEEMPPVTERMEFSIYGKDEQLIEVITDHQWKIQTVSIPVRVVPAICFPFRKRNLHRLPDATYGEWLIYENDQPRYYLNLFDEIYEHVNRFLETRADVSVGSMLKRSLGARDLQLSLEEKFRTIVLLESQSELVTLELEKFPPYLFDLKGHPYIIGNH
jgi:hypothetical protein